MFPKVNLEQDFGIYLYINQQQCKKACMNEYKKLLAIISLSI